MTYISMHLNTVKQKALEAAAIEAAVAAFKRSRA